MSSGLLLGNANLGLLGVVLLFVVYKFVFKNYLAPKKNETFAKLYRTLKNLHPLAAIMMLVFGLIHGYLMLGGFGFHTGSLIIIALVFMLGTYMAGRNAAYKQKWKVWHKAGAVMVLITVFIHLQFPYII